ncbi:MAG TPA: zinc-dependent metalloprotease family protein, partial [Lacibacter sp.]|nr:zinc-dependent metalloprotease family protein [Lacibacter sp.]
MQFKIVEASVIHPDLKARYPRIRSYSGRSLTEAGTSIRFSFTPQGFNAVILFADKPAVYIEKLEKGNNLYMVVSQKDLPAVKDFECFTKDIRQQSKIMAKSSGSFGTLDADNGNLLIFRLAFAASAEFSQWCLTGAEANDDERRATVLAEQNAQLTIVNGHMERDFGVRMEIIADNTDIIYLDAASDPFTGGDPDSDVINAEAQSAITTEIGSANFDIGHLIRLSSGTGSYGNAGAIGAVCQNDIKARGFTSRPDWNATGVYSEIMLTHEFGHQMGANHTFTHKDDNDNAQMEPGSGSTIMSYGGNVDGYNVVPRRDHYFHAISIQQATAYVGAAGCGSTVSANNTAPAADAGSSYTIPKSTPFKLTGIGSDADGEDELTFTWEQMDKLTEDADFPRSPGTTNTNGPVFRSRPPGGDNFRNFPILENILDGSNTNTWEKLPSVDRTLNFRFTVRDNNPGAGQNNSDDMVVTVDDAYGPFTVTSPNSAITWCPGTHTVTWDVNGSDALAANVKISLSTDGGQTFSTLVASTANDGSADVTIACTYNTTARIKVEAVGNIFFDISNTNFTVGDNTKPTFTVPADVIIEKDANCNYNASTGETGDVTDEADNCSSSLNATYTDAPEAGACVGETIIKRTWTLIDGCNNKTEKVQTITVKDVTAPTFTVPADITIYKDENCNHNDDPSVTGNPTLVNDNCDPTPDIAYSDVDAPGSCMGEVIITRTWKVTDDCGNKTEKVQTITVKDTIPPTISNISADPAYLWPPNHKMVTVTINYDVADNCSDQAHITKQLSIVSNEPINGLGDGDTEPIDYEVVGTEAHTVRLRAERAGNGDGRIYTIYITATDDCGNSTTDSAKVYVVHNITGPNSGKPFKIGSTVTMNGEFWDVPGNKHTAKWMLDDATAVTATVTEPAGTRKGLVAGSYKFNTAGVYKVKMSITDQNGMNSYATTNGDQEQIIVIYDPEGGHTFGGGWYASPAGALK